MKPTITGFLKRRVQARAVHARSPKIFLLLVFAWVVGWQGRATFVNVNSNLEVPGAYKYSLSVAGVTELSDKAPGGPNCLSAGFNLDLKPGDYWITLERSDLVNYCGSFGSRWINVW